MSQVMLPVYTSYTGTGASTVGIHVYSDGRASLSGIGALRPVYTATVTYWAAVPAVAGLTLTAFGSANPSLVPAGATLVAAQNLLLSAPAIAALNAIGPIYVDQFVTQ